MYKVFLFQTDENAKMVDHDAQVTENISHENIEASQDRRAADIETAVVSSAEEREEVKETYRAKSHQTDKDSVVCILCLD